MIIESLEITKISDWSVKLADLVRIAWSDEQGTCHFPYAPLTQSMFWETSILQEWRKGSIRSWIWVDEQGAILAHVALVKKGTYFELGRWVAHSCAPRGTISALCRLALDFATINRWKVVVEATQAHTTSQHICLQLGLRFAGIGVLANIENVAWDIVYFDNEPSPFFVPRLGILGDPLGTELPVTPELLPRLQEISRIITIDRGGVLPPQQFHIHPELETLLRKILTLNVTDMV